MAMYAQGDAASKPMGVSVSAAFWLGATLFLALVLYYFVGIDQGAVSLFGNDDYVHEFMHDGRHFAGFPCH